MSENKEKVLLTTSCRVPKHPTALESESEGEPRDAIKPLRSAIGKFIKDWRSRTGYSQTVLARQVKLTQAQLSDIETGKASLVGLDQLVAISDVMGITPGALIDASNFLNERIYVPVNIRGEYQSYMVVAIGPYGDLFVAPDITKTLTAFNKSGKPLVTTLKKLDFNNILKLDPKKVQRLPGRIAMSLYTEIPRLV